jgi:hypothetical protein
MIPFVRDDFAGVVARRHHTDSREIILRRFQRFAQGCRIALVRLVDGRGDDDARVEIDRMFRLVGLDESIGPGVDQNPLEPVVKNVARRARKLGPTHHQIVLRSSLPPHRHRKRPVRLSSSDGIRPSRLRQRAAKVDL